MSLDAIVGIVGVVFVACAVGGLVWMVESNQ